MMEQVKLFSLTAVITLLIWWSADSLVNETVTVGVSFAPTPPPTSPDMLVAVDGEPVVYQVEILGPRRTIDQFRSKSTLTVRLPVSDRPTGPAQLRLDRTTVRRAIADQRPDLQNVTVVSVEPNTLDVLIDHMVVQDVEIVARRLSLSYEVEPRLQTTAARVRMRESALSKLPSGQSLQIGIGPDLERLLRDRPAGESETVQVPLDGRRFGPDATITPTKVEVTATVLADRVTAQIATVPILFAMSPANLERRVQPATRDGDPLPLVTQTISVTGPREDVARLQRGDTRVHGTIRLKQEDFETLGVLKLVIPEYRLPEGVELAQQPPPIEFKLVPVADAATGR